MKWLLASFLLTCSCSYSQFLRPEIKQLMNKTELNQNYTPVLEAKQWMHQRVTPHFIYTINPKVNLNQPGKYGYLKTPYMIHSPWPVYRFKISTKDSLRLLSGIRSNKKPGLYFLSQDHMPCIVPDTKEIAAIPNLWPSIKPTRIRGNMPNPAPPVITLPD